MGFAPALVLLGFPAWPATLSLHPSPPLRVFPLCALPGPRHQSPLATWSRRLSQSLPFLHCEAAVFLARWPRLGHIALPRPLTHRLVFQLFDQTIPLFSSATPRPIWDGFGGGRAASGLKTVLQNNVVS